MSRLAVASTCALLVVASACAGDDGGSSASTTSRTSAAPATTMPRGTPPEVARAATDWPLPDHDYANSRATTSSHIDASNVAQLDVAWTAKPAGLGSPQLVALALPKP